MIFLSTPIILSAVVELLDVDAFCMPLPHSRELLAVLTLGVALLPPRRPSPPSRELIVLLLCAGRLLPRRTPLPPSRESIVLALGAFPWILPPSCEFSADFSSFPPAATLTGSGLVTSRCRVRYLEPNDVLKDVRRDDNVFVRLNPAMTAFRKRISYK